MRQKFLVTPELFRDYNLKVITRVKIPTAVQYGQETKQQQQAGAFFILNEKFNSH